MDTPFKDLIERTLHDCGDWNTATYALLSGTDPLATKEVLGRNPESLTTPERIGVREVLLRKAGVRDPHTGAIYCAVYDNIKVSTAAQYGAKVSNASALTFGDLAAAACIAEKDGYVAAHTLYLFANACDKQLPWENLSMICRNLKHGDVYGEYHLATRQDPYDFMDIPKQAATSPYERLIAEAKKLGVPEYQLQTYWEMFNEKGYCAVNEPPVADWCKASVAYKQAVGESPISEFLEQLPYEQAAVDEYGRICEVMEAYTHDEALAGLCVTFGLEWVDGEPSYYNKEHVLDAFREFGGKAGAALEDKEDAEFARAKAEFIQHYASTFGDQPTEKVLERLKVLFIDYSDFQMNLPEYLMRLAPEGKG